ncbi:MAG: hypothetical protein AB7R55_00755 [Gemmatimonadales bacterium]
MVRRRSLLAALFAFTVATPLLAGPAWIAIEFPANPYAPGSQDAFLMVHAFHHRAPAGLTVTGTAEGIVGGARRSIPLTLRATQRTGVFALSNQWGDAGVWSLVLTVTEAKENQAQALVKVSGGKVVGVEVATRQGRDGARPLTFPRPFTQAEIEASLRDRAE